MGSFLWPYLYYFRFSRHSWRVIYLTNNQGDNEVSKQDDTWLTTDRMADWKIKLGLLIYWPND
jgi:hypothetical protein